MTGSPSPHDLNLNQYRSYLCLLARMQLHRRLSRRVDASDIVQQTMLQAHRARGQLQGSSPAQVAAWLRQILARNLAHAARDHQREKRDVRREQSLEAAVHASSCRLEQWLATDAETPRNQAEHHEQLLKLAEAVEALPQAQREAIVLHYWEGCSLADVGQQLGRSPSAVAGLLHRGLKKLRQTLHSSS